MQTVVTRTTLALLLAVAAGGLSGCGLSFDSLNDLARSGEINQGAPVLAHAQADIAAPPAKVWALLINAPAWPRWQKNITDVSAPGPLVIGTHFTWKSGGSTIHSQVKFLDTEHRLAWTGTAFPAKAIHVWELTPQPNGHTLVTIQESMDGPLMAALFSSHKLTESSNAWLASLKRASEQTP